VAHRVAAQGYETILRKSPPEALAEARRRASAAHPIVVSGSFYMVAEIRRLVLS
jgi:folylpolyglutamate synthase/dihydropteroate synthase